jgi:hypothetical protein
MFELLFVINNFLCVPYKGTTLLDLRSRGNKSLSYNLTNALDCLTIFQINIYTG